MALIGSASKATELQGSVESGGTLLGKMAILEAIRGYSAYEVAVINGFSGTELEWLETLKGKQGEQGEQGEPGSVVFEELTEEQMELLRGYPGKDGEDGADGKDGVSPTVNVETIDGGKRITITDASGTNTVDLMDGEDGQDGQDGADGADGQDGADGATLVSLARTSGTGAAGTTDTYTMTMSDGKKFTFQVYNGADGQGAGDMLKSVYDPQNKNTDVFQYIDDALADIDVDVTADEVTFSDGETFQQKYDSGELTGPAGADGQDGKDGAAGANGADGQDGADGADGVGIASIEQTTTSTEDGGENVFTVTLTNGQTATFSVKNGSKGSAGAAGADGKDGSDGAAGKDGSDGADATINGVNALTLTVEEPLSLTHEGDTATLALDGVVRYGASQSLTTAQKKQARDNIGAAPAIAYGTSDVTAGATSSYPEGTLYVVIE